MSSDHTVNQPPLIDVTLLGCNGGWRKYEKNPVVGGELGECFDMSVVEHDGKLLMYFSWRSKKAIALVESDDGLNWSEPTIVLSPSSSGWESDVNRPSVMLRDGQWRMWYSGQVHGKIVNDVGRLEVSDGSSAIGYASSSDGVHWERSKDPVMVADQEWESQSVMCPDVMWDEDLGTYRMWYSAGGFFEPDAMGHATSGDGFSWRKDERNPIFTPEKDALWERERTTAGQVLKVDGWYVMFYIGFEDIDKARISAARSLDGITGWQRHKDNPLISGGRANGWDCEAAYKPFLVRRDDGWLMLYNGRKGFVEQIGVAFHGDDLGF